VIEMREAMIVFSMIYEERRRRQYSFSTGEHQVDACAGSCPVSMF